MRSTEHFFATAVMACFVFAMAWAVGNPESKSSMVKGDPLTIPEPKWPLVRGDSLTIPQLVPPTVIHAESQVDCIGICEAECISARGDKTVIVLGAHSALSAGYSWDTLTTAHQIIANKCGEDSVEMLIQPERTELLDYLQRYSDELVGLVFIGEGTRDGLILSNHRTPVPEDNVLTEEHLAQALVSSSVEVAQFYACDQGTISGHTWAESLPVQQLVLFEQGASVPDIAEQYIRLVENIPCSSEKLVCLD